MTTPAWNNLSAKKRANLQSALKPAQETERAYGVPTCITLAQFMLESNVGLADCGGAKNFFGVKAGGNWTGETVLVPTKEFRRGRYVTEMAEFRKYKTVKDSFVDHARFLAHGTRYSGLFRLPRTDDNKIDYKAWCHGLKAAGYATDPDYAPKLIALIEKYGLHYYNLAT